MTKIKYAKLKQEDHYFLIAPLRLKCDMKVLDICFCYEFTDLYRHKLTVPKWWVAMQPVLVVSDRKYFRYIPSKRFFPKKINALTA